MSDSTPTLEPCPFCGGNATLRFRDLDERFSYGRLAWVECSTCGARSGDRYNDSPERGQYAIRNTADPKAIEAWNTRAGNDELVEALKPWLRHTLSCSSQRDLHSDTKCRCGLDAATARTQEQSDG